MSMQVDSFSFCYFTMLAGFGNLNVLETVLVLVAWFTKFLVVQLAGKRKTSGGDAGDVMKWRRLQYCIY